MSGSKLGGRESMKIINLYRQDLAGTMLSKARSQSHVMQLTASLA
jgi:hypothetical protein